MSEDDVITRPHHYTEHGGIEVIDILKAVLTPEEFRGYLKGNILKYTARERKKGGDKDMKKAAWYARFLTGDDPRVKKCCGGCTNKLPPC